MASPTIFPERLLLRFKYQLLPFVERAGVPASFLTTPEMEISVDKYVALLDLAAKESDPLIGLEGIVKLK